MADETVVHIGENSPEYVAYRLMHMTATHEDLYDNFDRTKYLDLYAECLTAVSHRRRRQT